MRRYWIDKDQITDGQVIIKDDPFHHIFGVCRQEVGSKFEVLSDNKKALLVEVETIGKKNAICKIISERLVPELKKPHIHLCLSISRYNVMDAIIEKAVEMGVHTIHPFFSEFSFIRSASSLPANKVDRWEKIVISATQQCGRGELLNITTAVALKDLLLRFNPNASKLGLFAYEGNTDLGLAEYLNSNVENSQTELEEIWLFVGSEGGFSTKEAQEFHKLNLRPVSLGDQVLRVETACITLVAILKYKFGLL